MRLIDADAFIADAKMVGLNTAEKVLFALLHQPSIDLVRCGECKYWKAEEKVRCRLLPFADADDYCSYGERRADDE